MAFRTLVLGSYDEKVSNYKISNSRFALALGSLSLFFIMFTTNYASKGTLMLRLLGYSPVKLLVLVDTIEYNF